MWRLNSIKFYRNRFSPKTYESLDENFCFFLVFSRTMKSDRWTEMSQNQKQELFFKKEKVTGRNVSS